VVKSIHFVGWNPWVLYSGKMMRSSPGNPRFDPQIIWDNTTNSFYYVMDSIISSSDNRLAFGFSKSSVPNTTADWCKYYIHYAGTFPDFPKLGDSRYFLLIGVDAYIGNPFVRADILSLPKPTGTTTISTCPSFSTLMNGRGLVFHDIRDANNNKVFSPTTANSIDNFTFGYVVARSLALPSTKLWIVPMTGPATGAPTELATRTLTVPIYSIPPSATQPTFTQKLDTSDTRLTQAVLARNPGRGNDWSMWTQQTIANGATASKIQFYEFRPTLSSPPLLRSGSIVSSSTTFLFNAAISPDRRVDGATSANGENFVIDYSVSIPAISARIVAGSSINGAAPTFVLVKNGLGPYRDFSCAGAGQVCRWGDYSAAAPDPRPQNEATRAVAIVNQWSPGGDMPTTQGNWRTWAAYIRP